MVTFLSLATPNTHFHSSLNMLYIVDTGVLIFSKRCLFDEYYLYFKFFPWGEKSSFKEILRVLLFVFPQIKYRLIHSANPSIIHSLIIYHVSIMLVMLVITENNSVFTQIADA